MKVSWRTLGTVLLEEEVLDKAFACKEGADRVDDPDRVFREEANDSNGSNRSGHHRHRIPELVAAWPSLDQSPLFDVAMIDACVGCDDYGRTSLRCSGHPSRCCESPPKREENHPHRPNRFDARGSSRGLRTHLVHHAPGWPSRHG